MCSFGEQEGQAGGLETGRLEPAPEETLGGLEQNTGGGRPETPSGPCGVVPPPASQEDELGPGLSLSQWAGQLFDFQRLHPCWKHHPPLRVGGTLASRAVFRAPGPLWLNLGWGSSEERVGVHVALCGWQG